MTLEETTNLLRYIAAIDGRRITKDTTTAWQHLFARHDYQPVFDATQTAIRNASGRYLEASMIFDVLRRQPTTQHPTRRCPHGQPLGNYCHDCVHTHDCYVCQPNADPAIMRNIIKLADHTGHGKTAAQQGINTTCPCNMCGGPQ
jgi:hypothetical protein